MSCSHSVPCKYYSSSVRLPPMCRWSFVLSTPENIRSLTNSRSPATGAGLLQTHQARGDSCPSVGPLTPGQAKGRGELAMAQCHAPSKKPIPTQVTTCTKLNHHLIQTICAERRYRMLSCLSNSMNTTAPLLESSFIYPFHSFFKWK